jgi:hypothetical protein
MPLTERDYTNPRWIRPRLDQATLSRDDNRRFDQMTSQYAQGDRGRGWRRRPYMGHNTTNPSTAADRPRLRVDRVYIRTR